MRKQSITTNHHVRWYQLMNPGDKAPRTHQPLLITPLSSFIAWDRGVPKSKATRWSGHNNIHLCPILSHSLRCPSPRHQINTLVLRWPRAQLQKDSKQVCRSFTFRTNSDNCFTYLVILSNAATVTPSSALQSHQPFHRSLYPGHHQL